MRRTGVFLLLFVYLFANTELHELVKVRAFLSHFSEHKNENPDLSLWSFIKMHYFNGNKIDDDYAKDVQLPFKTADCNAFGLTHMAPAPEDFWILIQEFVEPRKLPVYDQSALPSSPQADIWQPPKFAC